MKTREVCKRRGYSVLSDEEPGVSKSVSSTKAKSGFDGFLCANPNTKECPQEKDEYDI